MHQWRFGEPRKINRHNSEAEQVIGLQATAKAPCDHRFFTAT